MEVGVWRDGTKDSAQRRLGMKGVLAGDAKPGAGEAKEGILFTGDLDASVPGDGRIGIGDSFQQWGKGTVALGA
jgi:hypothetical protein